MLMQAIAPHPMEDASTHEADSAALAAILQRIKAAAEAVASQALSRATDPSRTSSSSKAVLPPKHATRETNCRPELALHRRPQTYQTPPGGLEKLLGNELRPESLAGVVRSPPSAADTDPSVLHELAEAAGHLEPSSRSWGIAKAVRARSARRARGEFRVDTVTPWQLADAVGAEPPRQRSRSEPPAMLTIRSFHPEALGLRNAGAGATWRLLQAHTNGLELFNPGPSFQRRCQFRRPRSASVAALCARSHAEASLRARSAEPAPRSEPPTGCQVSIVDVRMPVTHTEARGHLLARASVANPQKGFRTRCVP
jgi:hypothetical protein